MACLLRYQKLSRCVVLRHLRRKIILGCRWFDFLGRRSPGRPRQPLLSYHESCLLMRACSWRNWYCWSPMHLDQWAGLNLLGATSWRGHQWPTSLDSCGVLWHHWKFAPRLHFLLPAESFSSFAWTFFGRFEGSSTDWQGRSLLFSFGKVSCFSVNWALFLAS